MAQIIAATVKNEIQISKVKSIFLHAVERYVNETLYSVFLNTALASKKFRSKFSEKYESYQEICELKMAGMYRKVSKFSSKTLIPS